MRPRSSVSLRSGGRGDVRTFVFPGRSPLLVARLATADLSISPCERDRVSPEDVTFARALAEETRIYRVAVERMFAGLPVRVVVR